MRALSAPDTITPAIERTRSLLFRPFRWGTYLKLSLVALITEGLGGDFHSSWNFGHSSHHGPAIHSPFHLSPEWIVAIVAGSLLFTALMIVVYYLITRLRFAFFHCLIHNSTEIRPGWRLYRPQAVRFFWLNIVVGFCFLLLIALIALPFLAGFLQLFRETAAGGKPDIGLVLSLLLPLIPIILLLALAGFLVDLILRDLMLPHFALDNATAGEAWAAVRARIKTEKGPFLVYALLRAILPIVAAIAMVIVMMIPALVFIFVIAALVTGIHSSIAGASGAAAVIGILAEVVFGLALLALAVLAGICVGGPLSTGIREFALVFYGGRYQKLGDILSPPEVSPETLGIG